MNIATLEKNKSLIYLVDLNFQNLRDIQLHMPNSFKTFYNIDKLAELFKTVKDPNLIKPLMVDQEKIDSIFLLLKKTDLSMMTLVSE